jgi:hypothetical protein
MQLTRNSLITAACTLAACAFAAPVFAAGPQIGSVTPVSATANVPVTLSASVSSGVGIQSCDLYVDLDDVGPMTVSGGTASAQYTFTSGGSRVAFVFCKDMNSGLGAGPNTAIWVNGAISSQPPLSGSEDSQSASESSPSVSTSTETTVVTPTTTTPTGPAAGSLIKLDCPAGAASDDPCTAVYYVGKDGKRHAFPNSKVFFSWYSDFSSVQTVSGDVMGGFMLGKNVTYRPGSRMVKFTTDPKVYAVSKGGQLQWVSTEAVATALYGSDWNAKIDDIPDTFYSNYTFGADVSDGSTYSASSQLNGAPTIDDSL